VHGDLPPPAYGGPPDDRPQAAAPAATATTAAGGPADAAQQPSSGTAPASLVWHLLLALAGGLILNVMPCVLPVISIKVLSFVNQSGEHRWRIFVLGLTFAAGIIASFLALAVLIIALESQWGGLFQRPRVVISLAAVVTAFALSLFGVFSLNPPRVANELGGHVRSEGVLGTFAMGLLATVLGTACTAPFLSAVVAIATQQPIVVAVAIFAIAGFGMALPYILLAGNPGWLRFVPRPGPWMESFERIVGFALLATVVWLINPLGTQVGTNGLLWTLVFLLFVAAACWVFGKRDLTVPPSQRLRVYAGAAVLLVGGWWLCFRVAAPIDELVAAQIELRKVGGAAASTIDWKDGSRIPWIPYTRERAEKYVRSGHAVFIDYTADWCVNCKANERLVLETDAVRSVMRDLGVVPLKADYTVEDPEIKEDLRRFGRAGVPMYLVFPAGRLDDVRILPEILTTGIVIDALRAAGPSNRVESVQSEPRP
jgi:thiol:disulfide interchange protein